jgi:hypothetical protein
MGAGLDKFLKGTTDAINRIKQEINPMGEARRREEQKIEDMTANPEKYEKLEDTLLCIKRDDEGRLMVFNQITNPKDAREIAFEVDTIMMQFRMMILSRAAQQGVTSPGGIVLPGQKR